MKCRLIAAGTRLPPWVNTAFGEYARRLRRPLSLELHEIAVSTVAKEGAAMLAALHREDYVVALSIAGKSMDTGTFSTWLQRRLAEGRALALLIGGPDGLGKECLERADMQWSLSPLTLPHALVRVVVAEQLYRAISMHSGHPYHRA
jgi:23S rRNA (pseudouridine1915-N3)-methyltransferase